MTSMTSARLANGTELRNGAAGLLADGERLARLLASFGWHPDRLTAWSDTPAPTLTDLGVRWQDVGLEAENDHEGHFISGLAGRGDFRTAAHQFGLSIREHLPETTDEELSEFEAGRRDAVRGETLVERGRNPSYQKGYQYGLGLLGGNWHLTTEGVGSLTTDMLVMEIMDAGIRAADLVAWFLAEIGMRELHTRRGPAMFAMWPWQSCLTLFRDGGCPFRSPGDGRVFPGRYHAGFRDVREKRCRRAWLAGFSQGLGGCADTRGEYATSPADYRKAEERGFTFGNEVYSTIYDLEKGTAARLATQDGRP